MLGHIHPLSFLVALLACWLNRRRLDAIDYLKEENRSLEERLSGVVFDLRTPNGVDSPAEHMRWDARRSPASLPPAPAH